MSSRRGALRGHCVSGGRWRLIFSLALFAVLVRQIGLTESSASQLPGQPKPNQVVDAPLPPLEAAQSMQVPNGFKVTLFAGEPDCQQPIGFCIDDRGRLWVAEAYNYPVHGTKAGDRIIIFEDVDGDGRFDKRTVFYDRLNYVTGIEVGFGGAWVMSPPYFYFIPDRDGDDKPDGEPQILLDGFGNHANAHNLANGFSWGPDGWLYGTHGRTNWSRIGKPGTPKEQRVQFDGGVYRYHPVRHVWEPYADGTTNPWGIDWNDVGEAFICNCVNPHLFHVIPGAHYEPWRNRQSSQFAYQRIPTIADHLHFVGKATVQEGLGSADEDMAGGGHAHCGTMIYLGDNWPEQYRNTLFTNNIHGRRINNDILKRHGSGYTASHGRDLMRARDPWFMGVTLRYGPDGAVYVCDWSDTGECHSTRNTQRQTGRIYKISYGEVKSSPVNLTLLSDLELVELQHHRNDWFVQHARRLLQERAAAGKDLTQVAARLHFNGAAARSIPLKLRALWALHVICKLPPDVLAQQLQHENESIRAWAARLLCEPGDPSQDILDQFQKMARQDPSPLVRLHLASLLQRLKPANRWAIAEALLSHAEDATDDNLPLMIWYGIEPLIEADLSRFIGLNSVCRIPLVTRHIGRRVTSHPDNTTGMNLLVTQLPGLSATYQSELLAGMLEGLAGQRAAKLPLDWKKVAPKLEGSYDETVRERALQLALVFNDPDALSRLRDVSMDRKADTAERTRAIEALVAKRSGPVAEMLLSLLDDPKVRRAAIRGLAEFDHPATAERLLQNFGQLDAATRLDVTQTLAARPPWAAQLVNALESGAIARNDISAYTARQLFNLRDPKLVARLKQHWGELRTTSAEKAKRIEGYKRSLAPEILSKADRSAGRLVFEKTCANCHRLFGSGGTIGPDITGSQRTNLEYLLQTLVDPSATVSKDYQMQIVETTTGRVITGLVVDETPAAVTLQTVNEKVVLPAAEIESRQTSDLSIMPEGMLQTLSAEQVRNLIAYLMGPHQVSPRNQPDTESK